MPSVARSSIATCLLLLVGCSLSLADVTLAPTHYDLEIGIDYEAQTLCGRARITFTNVSDAPADEVSLVLYRLQQVRSVRDEAGNDLEFSQCVVGLDDYPVWQVNHIVVTLAEPLAPGEETAIDIAHDGYLLGYTETGSSYVRDSIDREFTIIRTDSRAYPMLGRPSVVSARALVAYDFSYSARITVPPELTVVCGGRLEGIEESDGTRTFEFTSVLPSWRMDFAIADYRELSRGPIRVCYLPGDAGGAEGVVGAAEDALEYFTDWFGSRPTASTLTFIEIPDGWGSQTDVTTIIQSAGAFTDPSRHREVYHEISHLWNVLPTDSPSPRWEEGLATFLEFLLKEEITGEQSVAQLEEWLFGVLLETIERRPELREIPLVDYGRENLTDVSYRSGALFFGLLYRLEGHERFGRIISEYISSHAEAGGTTQDLVGVIVRLGGEHADVLCRDWILTAGWADLIGAGATAEGLADHYRGPAAD